MELENNSSPSQSLGVVIGIRVGVGASSFLSVLGASLVIASYAVFRDLRTTGRLLLVNLSVADLLVSASHLVGLVENIGTFTTDPYGENGTMLHWLCTAQAAFSVFGTESSILWTIAVAAYLFTLAYSKWPAVAKLLVPVFHVACWGIPIAITVSLGATGLLGFQPGGDPAFCGILGTVTVNSTTKHIVYPIIVGYEVWNYLAFLVLPILYISVRCRIRLATRSDSTCRGRNTGHYTKLSAAAKSADWKLISVPLIYMLLRVWSMAVDIAVYYLPEDARAVYIQSPVSAVLLILVGVCDSAQGFANGVLFCVCTQAVRERLLGAVKRYCCCCTCRRTCYCGCVCCRVCNRSQLPAAEYESTTSIRGEAEWLIRYNGIALTESTTETSYYSCIQAPDSENSTTDIQTS